MTKKEAQNIIRRAKKIRLKCIVPNEVFEALDVLYGSKTIKTRERSH